MRLTSEQLVDRLKEITSQIARLDGFERAAPIQLHYVALQACLDYGEHWTPQDLPALYAVGVESYCFHNAYKLLLTHGDTLRYVEGLAVSNLTNTYFLHAWCVDRCGRVIDNTWPTIGAAYFGIAFPTDYILDVISERILTKAEGRSVRYGILGHLTPYDSLAEVLGEPQTLFSVD